MIVIESKETQVKTVLNEIKYLRGMQSFLIDTRNSNQYRVIVKEKLGHTAYCFSTPIYNIDTQKITNREFCKTKTGYTFKGTNGTVSIYQNRCVLENKDGRAVLLLNDTPMIQGFQGSERSNIIVAPTLNGICFVIDKKNFSCSLSFEAKHERILYNSSCFSIMQEKFKPFLSVSTLYATDGKETFLPVEIRHIENGPQSYTLDFNHKVPGGTFMFEMNLYEPKLFQDTTVESMHPDKNNAYGSIGFIGKTKQHGEQWLYSRPDFSKISDLTSSRIDKVLLHIPVLNGSLENVEVYIPEKRFCSFGSTWNKKVNSSGKVASSNNNGRYITIDVTSMFTNRSEQILEYNEGLILKKPKGKNDFIAISTGDCYFSPQILEIKFKN